MSAERSVHIISFDVPFPADYGGVIDVLNKIKALHGIGVKVNLHCFYYRRPPADQLSQWCESVHYYPRLKSPKLLFNRLPYIVCSRVSDQLKENLLKDNFPILMEGIHVTSLLNDPDFSGRRMIVRSHNVEHDYYNGLAKAEHALLKKWYLKMEAHKLKGYEPIMSRAHAIAAISPADTAYFQKQYGNAFYLPVFHPFDAVQESPVTESFAFYHGNLSVAENDEAAMFLVTKVFSGLTYPLVIAGSNPSSRLSQSVEKVSNVKLLTGLSPDEIHQYIAKAKVNVLPTFQSTGIKLKLLASLFIGKSCLVNTPMVEGTGLEQLCIIADTPEDFKNALNNLFSGSGDAKYDLKSRREILEKSFSNVLNAGLLASKLFE